MKTKYQTLSSRNDLILEPSDVKINSSLIFLHGLGDSASGWHDFFDAGNVVPDSARVILLTAPETPVTVNNGAVMNSWYDIYSPETSKSRYNIDDVNKNQKRVLECINQQLEFHHGNPSKIFIGGFSQGAAMSMHIGLEHSMKLGGVFALSGYLFSETRINQTDLDLLITHGSIDDKITPSRAELSYQRIMKSKNVSYNLIDGLTHSVDQRVMHLMKIFLKNLIK
jgi:predicted esterase